MTHSVSNLHEAQTVMVGVDTHKHMHVAVAIDSRGIRLGATRSVPIRRGIGCFRHQLLLPRPYLVLTKPLRLDIQCQRAASVKIGWKYLDD